MIHKESDYQRVRMDPVTSEFVEKHLKDCAIVPFRHWQILFHALVLLTMTGLLFYRWDIFIFIVTAYFAFWYLCAAFFRSVAIFIAVSGRGQREVSERELNSLRDDELPIYTIIAPLYREASVAGKLIKNLEALDYPKDKLDVKLVLESDDDETLGALNAVELPDHFERIVVPDFEPKTKPRACNFALKEAKGRYCVIYDAEDRPDPDQLKKAVTTFNRLGDDVVCAQAKLNYYNARQNLLTRLFAIEYETTFDLYLPGLEVMNVPIPLGGTSNHFRVQTLREIGGWDPFNVTEDCDLGVRIYKKGYKTVLIDSTTWEEANSNVWNWIRQRSRWIKGFIQTHFTHARHPLRTLRGLGAWGTFGFYMTVGASSMMMIINVFYWATALLYTLLLAHGLAKGVPLWTMLSGPRERFVNDGITIFRTRLAAWPMVYHGPTEDPFWSALSIGFFSISCVLVFANVLFLGSHALACLKRKQHWLLPYVILMPFYWVLISIGAWKGFFQFFTRPFYWEKTKHGLDAPTNE